MNGTKFEHKQQQQHIATEHELIDLVEIVYLSLSVAIGTFLNLVAVVRLIRYSKSTSAHVKNHSLFRRPLYMNSFAMFKFNLAISDFAILFIHALGKMVWLLSYRWLFGDFGCRLYQFLSAFAYYSNSNVVVAVGLDRLKVVYSGQVQGVSSSTRRVRIFLIIAWVQAAICALPQLIFWTDFELGNGWSQCTTIWQIAEYSRASNGQIWTVNSTAEVPTTTTLQQQNEQQKDTSWSVSANTQLLYELLHQVIVFIIPLISLSASYLLIVVRVLRYSLRPPLNTNLCSYTSNCADQWSAAARDGRTAKCAAGKGWQSGIRMSRSAGSRNFFQRLRLLRQCGDGHLLHPSTSTSFSSRTQQQQQQKQSNTTNVTNSCFGPPSLTSTINHNNNSKNSNCRQCIIVPPPSTNDAIIVSTAEDTAAQMNCNGSSKTTAPFSTKFTYFTDDQTGNNTNQPIFESAADRLLLRLANKASADSAQPIRGQQPPKYNSNNKKLSTVEQLYGSYPHFQRYQSKRCSLNLVNLVPPPSSVAEQQQQDDVIACGTNARLLMPRGIVCPQSVPQQKVSTDFGQCVVTPRQHKALFGGRRPSAGSAVAAAPTSPLWRRQMRSKVFIRSLLIVAAHCAFWLPYNLLNLLRFTDETMYTQLVNRGALLVEDLIIMNSLINPVLYGCGK